MTDNPDVDEALSAIRPRWRSAKLCRMPRSPRRRSRKACCSFTPAPAKVSRRRHSDLCCARSDTAGASASCSSSRAPGIPANATRLQRFGDQVSWHTMGEGFTWETQDKARDIAAAAARLGQGQGTDGRSSIRLLILDELNIALRYDYLAARRRRSKRCAIAAPISTSS